MCIFSNISDMAIQRWSKPYPAYPTAPPAALPTRYVGPSREQFDELLKLLAQAKRFDAVTGQPDCEQDEKLAWLKAIAKHLGVPEPTL